MDTHIPNAPVGPPQPLDVKQVREWLDYAGAELSARRDEIIPALTATLEAHPAIQDGDEDTAGIFAENIRIAEALVRDIAAEHTVHKKPYLEGGRAVDDWKRVLTEAVSRALTPVKTVATAFATRKADLARAEAQRLAAEAAARAAAAEAEARRQVKQSVFSGAGAVEDARQLTQAAHIAEVAVIAKGAAASASRTVGHYGAQAALRVRWSYEIEDFEKIPLEFLQLNEDAVKLAAKERDKLTGRPTRVIPGIKWVESRTLAVR